MFTYLNIMTFLFVWGHSPASVFFLYIHIFIYMSDLFFLSRRFLPPVSPQQFRGYVAVFTMDGWMDGWMNGWMDGWILLYRFRKK